MRWQRLFAELEYEMALGADDPELSAQERRLAASRMTLVQRCDALAGQGRSLRFWSQHRVEILTPESVGADWFSGPGPTGEYRVVRLAAIDAFDGADAPCPDSTRSAPSPVTFAMVLRDLTRRRVPLTVVAEEGEYQGTLSGAWADHCELAVHPADTPCRASDVRERRILPYQKLRWITLAGPA